MKRTILGQLKEIGKLFTKRDIDVSKMTKIKGRQDMLQEEKITGEAKDCLIGTQDVNIVKKKKKRLNRWRNEIDVFANNFPNCSFLFSFS